MTVAFVWDWDAFQGHGTEYGINAGCSVSVYQGNRDAETFEQGPLAGIGVSVGKGFGYDFHIYKGYTWTVSVLDALAEAVAPWFEQADREIRRVYTGQ